MRNNLKLFICISILFILYYLIYVEKYTSERSQWEDSQQEEDTRTNWEKIGISEEEYNNMQSEWNSLIDHNNVNRGALDRDSNSNYSVFTQEYEDAESNWDEQETQDDYNSRLEGISDREAALGGSDPFEGWRNTNQEFLTADDASDHFGGADANLRVFCVSNNDDDWNSSL